MKPSFSLILSLLLCLSVNSIIQVNAQCWDHSNPLKPWEKTKSPTCGTQKKKIDDLDSLSGQQSVVAPENAFVFNFTCITDDQSLCPKAENSFKSAGAVIAKLISFNTPITVNATFANFCQTFGECGGNILGAASAARTIPLLDDDGIVRQYPQALAKQFLLSPQPQWGPFDILALFNAEAPLFFGGGGKIAANEFDFEYIIMHELIHGLGFASGWNNYFSDQPVALTPDPSFLEQLTSVTDPVTYTGFEQTAFDKYMVNAKDTTKSPVRMSDLAVEMNGFANVGTKFPSVQNLLDTFAGSDQFQLSKSLIGDAQTTKTFAFQPQNAASTDDLIFLETNLNPFQQGSSVSHMDAVSFTGSPDFLEVFKAVLGKSLDQILETSGGKFPIGPKLQSVLETLGYATADNPNPYKPKLPGTPQEQPNVPAPLPIGNGNNNSTAPTAPTDGGAGGGAGGAGAGTGAGGAGTGAGTGNIGAASVMNNSLDDKDSAAISLTSSFNILSVFIVVIVTLLF